MAFRPKGGNRTGGKKWNKN